MSQLKGPGNFKKRIGKGKDSIPKMLPLLLPIHLKGAGADEKPAEAKA